MQNIATWRLQSCCAGAVLAQQAAGGAARQPAAAGWDALPARCGVQALPARHRAPCSQGGQLTAWPQCPCSMRRFRAAVTACKASHMPWAHSLCWSVLLCTRKHCAESRAHNAAADFLSAQLDKAELRSALTVLSDVRAASRWRYKVFRLVWLVCASLSALNPIGTLEKHMPGRHSHN